MTTGRINQVSMLAMGAGLVSTESAIKRKLLEKELRIRITNRVKKKVPSSEKEKKRFFLNHFWWYANPFMLFFLFFFLFMSKDQCKRNKPYVAIDFSSFCDWFIFGLRQVFKYHSVFILVWLKKRRSISFRLYFFSCW